MKNPFNFSINRKQQGFTIVELMTTIIILSILLAFALPSFSDFLDRQRIKADAQSFANVLSSARAQALVIDSRSVTVQWNRTAADIPINDTTDAVAVVQQLPSGSIAVFNSATGRFITVSDFTDSGTVSIDNDGDDIVTFNSQGRVGGSDAGVNIVGFLFCKGPGDADDAIRVEIGPTGRVVQKLQTNPLGLVALNCPAA